MSSDNVVPIRPIADRLIDEPGTDVEVRKLDTSFEVDLDELGGAEKPRILNAVPVDVAGEKLLPIVPAWMQSREAMRNAAAFYGGRWWHISRAHALRSPWYAVLAAVWSVAGVFRLAGTQIRWWWQPGAVHLENEAANEGNYLAWRQVRGDAQSRRLFRGIILGVEAVSVAVLAAAAWFGPWWITAVVLVAAVPPLARFGRRRPIVSKVVITPRFRKLRYDIVLRAYYAARLGDPEKEGQQIEFGGPMSRDDLQTDSQVVVDLPYGRTFAEATAAKEKIASGLDVTVHQVFLTRDKTSNRRHMLFVADRDPLAVPAGKTPMLDCKVRDIWKPFWCGLDERRRKVVLNLLWISWLIGAQPRKGKTFTGRLLALYAALDPYTKLFIADGKDSPDWDAFRLVADRMVFGVAPNVRDSDPVTHLLEMLRHVKKHIERANSILASLPAHLRPEGKLTRDLHRDPRYPELCVWMVVIEEFQVYFETEDQDTNREVAGLLSFIAAVGPSAGVILVDLSQKPSGVGAGDVGRLFNRYRDNHTGRIALKCGNRVVSEAILGTEAYGEGYDAAALPLGDEYQGVGYVYGISDHVPTTRFHLADTVDAEKILRAARQHRELAGTLSGEAAGDVVYEGEVVDPLADALAVIHSTEANISWPRLAARLVEEWPERYEGITAAAVSKRLRDLGVKGKSVADADYFESGRGQGVARQQLADLAAKRAVDR